MKKIFFTITIILSFATHSIAQDSCDEQYGKATVIPDEGWCLYAKAQRDKGKPSASAECRCENSNEDSATNINADDNFDRYNQLNDKYQSLYAKVRNLGYDDVDEKLEILHSIKSYAAGLDALQNSTSYTANLNSDIQALEQQKKQQTITLSGKSSKANTYMTQKKAEAQQRLKEIEIEQERERKAQEREALKSKNYYKTSPNTIRTGGYPQNGYNQAMQNINRIDANYDALQQSINKLANTFSSGTKSKSIDFDEIDRYNDNLDRVAAQREQEVQAIYDVDKMISLIDKGDDYPYYSYESDFHSKNFKAFLESLKAIDENYLYIKFVGMKKIQGPKHPKDYYSMSKLYVGTKNEFDSNVKPIYNVLFGETQKVLINEILEHPYLFSLYISQLTKDDMHAERNFLFFNEPVLNLMIGKIKSTYQSARTLKFDSNYNRNQKTFNHYLKENLEKETQYYNKIEEFKKKKIIADKKISKKTENVKSTEIIDNKFFYRTKKHRKLIYYDNKNALIDENGEFLINPTFNKIRQIKNTHLYAIIKEEGKDGSDIILDANIFDPIKKEVYGDNNIYLILWNNSEYIILVNKQTHKKGIFNALTISSNKQSDKYKVPFLFDRIEAIDRSKLMVSNNGMKGLITNNSEVIIPFKYKDIIKEEMYLTTNYYCQTFENEKIWHMYDHRGKFKGTYKKTRSGFKLK